jgi:A/G-specific adenine glycosylase
MTLKALFSWSKNEFSHLPWRENRSLYRTLVSEIMLQQTTVGTVKNHYERFLLRFPTLESLANATEDELIVAWKGLGYYRRARSLKKMAEAIASEHKGKFPDDLEVLMKIPGIGPYTANAIVGIGMDKKALAVDANLERVIARLFGIKAEKGLKLQKEIYQQFVDKKIFNEKISFRELNESLMDLGRTFCQARKATCELCPLKKDCQAFALGKPLAFPFVDAQVKAKEKADEHEIHLLRIVVIKKDQMLVYKKSKSEWLSGQFEMPTFILSTTDKKLKQYPRLDSLDVEKISFSFITGITKYKIKNSVLISSEKDFKTFKFSSPVEWRSITDEDSNLSTSTLKAIAKLAKLPLKA